MHQPLPDNPNLGQPLPGQPNLGDANVGDANVGDPNTGNPNTGNPRLDASTSEPSKLEHGAPSGENRGIPLAAEEVAKARTSETAAAGMADKPTPVAGALWEELLASLRQRMQPEQFATWFSRAALVKVTDDAVEIAVLNEFARDWVQTYHRVAFEGAVQEVLGKKMRCILTVDPELAKATIKNEVLATGPARPGGDNPYSSSTYTQPEQRHGITPPGAAPQPSDRPGLLWSSDVELHPRYTFENYVVGPCNRFGHAAAMGAAEQPGKSYNPFFLHGLVGVGKTHLLQAVCHLILERQPGARILYLSCETFINHFVSALQDGDITTFRNKYRYVDVLVVDDIHLLANKERTQEEFFHTFNTLYNAGKQIVLSSDSPPKEIPTLQERLVSRFKWGMVTEIEPPCFETRMAIVKRKSGMENNEFPHVVAEYIAGHFESNVRELEGAVTRLLAFSSMTGRKVDLAMATEALSSILKTTRGQPTLDDVVQAVTKQYRLKPSDMQSSKRTRTIAMPRHVAMYLARMVTNSSFESIGAHFGGRDHSTVVYAVGKIEKLIKKGGPEIEEIGRLYTELTGRKMDQ